MTHDATDEVAAAAGRTLLLTACGLFVLTVFLMLTSALNPNAGLLARFFDLHGMLMLGVEVVAILVVAIIVVIVERRESRRRIQEQEAALIGIRFARIGTHRRVGRPASEPSAVPVRSTLDPRLSIREESPMTSSAKAEIEKLRDELRRHNRLYFVEAKPEITDLEFDKLMARLRETRVGASRVRFARQPVQASRRHSGRGVQHG